MNTTENLLKSLKNNLSPTAAVSLSKNTVFLNKSFKVKINEQRDEIPLEYFLGFLTNNDKTSLTNALSSVSAGAGTLTLDSFLLNSAYLITLKMIKIESEFFIELSLGQSFEALKVVKPVVGHSELIGLICSLSNNKVLSWVYDLDNGEVSALELCKKQDSFVNTTLTEVITLGAGSIVDYSVDIFYKELNSIRMKEKESTIFSLKIDSDNELHSIVAMYSLKKSAVEVHQIYGLTISSNKGLDKSFIDQLSSIEVPLKITEKSKKPKAIIVDDNRINLFILKDLMIGSGYDVNEVYSDPQDFLASGNWKEMDALVIDQAMPDLDGLSLTKLLRVRGFKGLILIITASDLTEDVALSAGANGLARKPISLYEFSDKLASLLN